MKLSMNAELEVGKGYLFRTVTMIYTGEYIGETDDYFILKKAAWIAETARWSDSVATGEFKEIEPYPAEKLVRVYKGGMSDIVEIPSLPLDRKPA